MGASQGSQTVVRQDVVTLCLPRGSPGSDCQALQAQNLCETRCGHINTECGNAISILKASSRRG